MLPLSWFFYLIENCGYAATKISAEKPYSQNADFTFFYDSNIFGGYP